MIPTRTAAPLTLALASLCCLAATPAQAIVQALQGRTQDGLAVPANSPLAVFEYDPNLDITWLRNWTASGQVNWEQAMAWADGLTLGGRTDWRLPSPRLVDGQGLCATRTCLSEMGYLWYKEWQNGTSPNPADGVPTYGVMQNVQRSAYWLNEPYAPISGLDWAFYVGLTLPGATTGLISTFAGHAVAVVDGDVLGAVPEPGTHMLLMGGMAGLVAWRARRVRVRWVESPRRRFLAEEAYGAALLA